jgi:hypothetical protein
MRAALTAEQAGVPSVSIVTTAFMGHAQAAARGYGISTSAIAEYPGVIPTEAPEVFERKIRDVLVDRIVAGFAAGVESVERPSEPAPRDIVFAGDFDAVQEHCHRMLWSDGLPVAPPTLAAVERFLGFTDRRPEEVLGTLLPENREATVWNVAVNGVMAGCRPQYMPVLLAIAEALCDPGFHIEHAGATPGWEPLVILSGPIVRQLDFNHGAGVTRVGRQANSSVGRFVRLYMRNVAGLRIQPGTGDKATFGLMFSPALCEDESAVLALGWPSHAMDRGFARDENVLEVRSMAGISPVSFSEGSTAEPHLHIITDKAQRFICDWTLGSAYMGAFHQLLVLSPMIAEVLARNGIDKPALREHLFQNARMRAAQAQRYLVDIQVDYREYVDKGLLPPEFLMSDDPERLVPVFVNREGISVIVAGDPGRNQSRWYLGLHVMGAPTSRRIVLPADFEARLARAAP